MLGFVDTSCVLAALGWSTAGQNGRFIEASDGLELHSSRYVRMELTRVWVCSWAQAAARVARSKDIPDALLWLSQSFSSGNVKAVMTLIAILVRRTLEQSPQTSTSNMSEEIAREIAYLLDEFDERFAITQNHSGCVRHQFAIGDDFFEDPILHIGEQVAAFKRHIDDCDVSLFLSFWDPASRCASVMDSLDPLKIKVIANIKKIAKRKRQPRKIGCSQCTKIGDLVISLETPEGARVLSTDESFRSLCPPLGLEFVKVPSVRACDIWEEDDEEGEETESASI